MDKTILYLCSRYVLPFIFLVSNLPVFSQTAIHHALIKTSYGTIKIVLYEETPFHSGNFIKLTGEGFYDGLLFHRVIKDFMIQTGDPSSRDAENAQILGLGGTGYTIPAEFHPSLYHKKGAVAAARMGDHVNPSRASSGSQFYIVQGSVFTPEQLDNMESNNTHIRFSDEQRLIYTTSGGTPHLDYAYTVFGEVVSGMDVVEKIAAVPTDQHNRPLDDIRISISMID